MKDKFVIVGHGLAGAVLAQTMIEHEQNVIVIDANMKHAATKVSAGLINPFVGPKLNVHENFDSYMQENHQFFNKMEKRSGLQIIEPITLYRIFQNREQSQKWNTLTGQYKSDSLSSSECKKLKIVSKFGAGKTRAWKLNSLDFIRYSKKVLCAIGSYLNEVFHAEKWRSHKIIFCNGYRASTDRIFDYLPFAPAQGEVIEINSPYSINASNGSWHINGKNENNSIIGSSWKHESIESGPTSSGYNEILNKIDYFPDLKDQPIVTHKSGVRSCTIDRQPIMGAHPSIKNYYLFNGFGSRGCTTISLCAKRFTDYLLNKGTLPPSLDLMRFTNHK